MVLIGLKVDSEARFFMEPLQLAADSLQGAKFSSEPGGRTGVGDSPGCDGGKRVQAAG